MGLFDRLSEPVFLREYQDHSDQIQQLKEIYPTLNEVGKSVLLKDMQLIEYGMIGEKNTAFELSHSHLPMYIIHDIYLEHEGLSAQIDYLVLTRKMCFVIECKNLYGNIEINHRGDFIRSIGKWKKERIYSPITQNQRHIELLKRLRKKEQNLFMQKLQQLFSEERYQSIVVLANPKTVVNDRYTRKEVKTQVIHIDQLITYIKQILEKSKNVAFSDKDLKKWAELHLALHQSKTYEYKKRYDKYQEDVPSVSNQETLIQSLKAFRLQKSREENVKAFYIFSDKQMNDLMMKMPKTKQELFKVTGFGEKRINKFGEELLEIIHQNT